MYFKTMKENCNEELYVKLLNELTIYSNCRVLDFGHLLPDDQYYYDFDHMNYTTSKLFTTVFADTVSKLNW